MTDKLVEITWLDACAENYHIPIESIKEVKPLVRKNIGYELDKTDDFVTISFGTINNLYHSETGYDGCLTIPKGMIIESREL